MKILVTGSSGWLARFLVPMLWAGGYEPVGLDLAASEWTDVIGNIADRALIDDLVTHKVA